MKARWAALALTLAMVGPSAGVPLPLDLPFASIYATIHNAPLHVEVKQELLSLVRDAEALLRIPSSRVEEVVEAQNRLVLASLRAKEALTPQDFLLDLPPVARIDLRVADDTYLVDYRLVIDLGGVDTYLNNAGGSAVAVVPGGQGCGLLDPPGAAALIDFAGDDRYVSNRACGINGGAVAGTGFLADLQGNDIYHATTGANGGAGGGGVGFLFDAGGDDVYLGGHSAATNGGAILAGIGRLIDLGGNDRYDSYGSGGNGGASLGGSGLLFDAAGDDYYRSITQGANGGVYFGGEGKLIDLSGNDEYFGGAEGANGGSYSVGSALLLDLAGNDRYLAEAFGVNGGVSRRGGGSAALLDYGGVDFYDDDDGTCWDCSVVPKWVVGLQLDATAAMVCGAEWPAALRTWCGPAWPREAGEVLLRALEIR